MYSQFAVKLAVLGICLSASQLVMAQAATMQDYWSGNAQWEFERKRTFNEPDWQFDSSIMRVVGNDWYLFSRSIESKPGCPGDVALGVKVRKSSDRGASWTSPIVAINPASSPASVCAATDGDAYFDAAQNKWRFLYQCLNTSNVWAGCYAERAGSDPMGTFTPVAQNPVIQARSLWSQICNTRSDKCVAQAGGRSVFDEGTFNIFRFDGSHFWISFHGYDGVNGYRGIAKTTDFLTYVAGGSNGGTGEATPSDAVLTKNDGATWREAWQGGNIGAGHGTIVEESGNYYMLAEMADKNLACTEGQNWDFGLFRSASLSSNTWAQFPAGNPVIYSSNEGGANALPCNLQYAQIFKDNTTNTFYLRYYRSENNWANRGTYFFRLKKSSNILKNADLWMANGSNWTRLPASPANLAVYRYASLSPDGTPILATNCGASTCAPGQSIYQDVDVTAYRGRSYSFGGKFSTSGGSGSLNLVVWQLDAAYNVLQNNVIPLTASSGSFTDTTSNAGMSPPLVISNQAKFLRYQFYLGSPSVTYLADNMFLNIN